MRIDALQLVIEKYKNRPRNGIPDNEYVLLLERFLESELLQERKPSDQVFYPDFLNYLEKNKYRSSLLNTRHLFKQERHAEQLFADFKDEPKKRSMKAQTTLLAKMPRELLLQLFVYLSLDRVAALASTSYAFYQLSHDPYIWREKLFNEGANISLSRAIQSNTIHDFHALYKNTFQLYERIAGVHHTWEWLCLSGELRAVKFGLTANLFDIKNVTINAANTRLGNRTWPLHIAAFAGNIEVTRLLRVFNNPNEKKLFPLHFAAFGGHLQAMRLEAESTRCLQKHLFNDVYEYATRGGSVAAMRTAEELGFPPMYPAASKAGSIEALQEVMLRTPSYYRFQVNSNSHHLSCMYESAEWGRVKMMRYLYQQVPGVKLLTCDNALHHAASKGQLNAMRVAVDELHIPEDSRDKEGRNALMIAAMASQIEAVIYAALELRIDVNSKDNQNRNAIDLVLTSIQYNLTDMITCLRSLGCVPEVVCQKEKEGKELYLIGKDYKHGCSPALFKAFTDPHPKRPEKPVFRFK